MHKTSFKELKQLANTVKIALYYRTEQEKKKLCEFLNINSTNNPNTSEDIVIFNISANNIVHLVGTSSLALFLMNDYVILTIDDLDLSCKNKPDDIKLTPEETLRQFGQMCKDTTCPKCPLMAYKVKFAISCPQLLIEYPDICVKEMHNYLKIKNHRKTQHTITIQINTPVDVAPEQLQKDIESALQADGYDVIPLQK